MAKDRHRIFEIYESRDEAAWELMPKANNAGNGATAASEPWLFKHLAVSQLAGITQVELKEADLSAHETIGELQDEFVQLADALSGASRVLLDFSAVQKFGPLGINALVLLHKKLHVRGSRMVLCCLDTDVRATIFAAD